MSNFAIQQSNKTFTGKEEGCMLKAYWDQSRWSIAYGNGTLKNGSKVVESSVITQSEGDFIFDRDLKEAARYVNAAVTSNINRNQFDALVDVVYNAGIGTYKKSNLYGLVNANPNNLPLIQAAFQQSPYPKYGRLDRCLRRYALYSSGNIATEEGLGSNTGLIFVGALGLGIYFATKKKGKQ